MFVGRIHVLSTLQPIISTILGNLLAICLIFYGPLKQIEDYGWIYL